MQRGEQTPSLWKQASVDDRPNELNIAFWVISSVGAASPLLLHIIYVSVHAPSLFLSFSSRTPTLTHSYLFLLLSVLHSLHFIHLQNLLFLPPSSLSVPWYLYFYFLSLFLCIFHSHSFLAYILVISVSFLYSFLSFLFFVPFSPSLRSSLFFCLTLSQSFFSFSAAIFPFELLSSLSFSFPPSHFEAMPMK